MFKDEHRDKVWNEIRQLDLRSFRDQLSPGLFADAAKQAGVRLGCSALNLVNLVWLGIACAWAPRASFAFVLMTTLKLLQDHERFSSTNVAKEQRNAQRRGQRKGGTRRSKHRPYGKDPVQVTEEAFTQARQRMPLAFWAALVTRLAQQFQLDHGRHVKCHGFRLLAMDGTTLTLPRDPRLLKHYGRPRNASRKQAAPQARMVMLTLPAVRIPLAYTLSPLATTDLQAARQLLGHVRANDLLLMDRGFFSYGLFWQLQQREAFFGTRLMQNVKYRKIKRLGSHDSLIEWKPKDSRRQWTDLPASIPLRLIKYQVAGFRPSAVVTNVLDPKRLSREDWVRLAVDCDGEGTWAPGLYHRRWEIETMFYELKVTLRMKSLRSRTPLSLQYEVAGQVTYYLLVRWLIVRAAEKHGVDPLRLSFTGAVRELEQMRAALLTSAPAWVTTQLLPRLLDRIASHLVPLRPGRHYERPNDTKPKVRENGNKQLSAKINNRVNTNYRKKKRQRLCKA